MKILQVNKFHYLRGGAERYYLEVGKKLEEKGHKLAYFSMKHPKNEASSWSKYFVSRLSFNSLSLKDYFKLPFRIIYSQEAKRKFQALLDKFSPDVIHMHNIYHHLSPSIIDVAYKKNIPVVLHLHDYKMICPNYQLYDGKNFLWNCCGQRSWNCFRKKCFKNSYFQSFLVSLEYFIHHQVLDIYRKKVSLFIAPSQFIKNSLVRFGFDESKIKVLRNFVLKEQIKEPDHKNSNYLLYFGRLSSEKGLELLLKALNKSKSSLKLKIVGDGPEASSLKKLSSKLNLDKQVEFTGALFKDKLLKEIDGAKAVLMPSIWPENMPFSLLEALARGKVVLASKVGGLPEVIRPGYNGLLFESNSVESLAKAIDSLETLNLKEMQINAYNSAKDLIIDRHVEEVLRLYNKLITNNRK
ncbi:MAG: glycosyltransferase [Candidatus Pacebacteria bacterium]|nr:glycosyltransferase [Candidatus Paceibacterota bacterium]